jgi:uncharacterized protein YutE (UPF0331/DUF86 family)
MVDADVITAKLRDLADRIGRVRTHRPLNATILATDRDARDLVSFNLMLAVQSCAEIAGHLIGDEGWPPATSLADAFQRLREHVVLSAATADALRSAAGLRNVVAHGYADVNPELLYAAAGEGLDDLERFAGEVSGWVLSRT